MPHQFNAGLPKSLLPSVLLLLTVIGFAGCWKANTIDCDHIVARRIYTERMENNGKVSFEHFLVLENYGDKCFNLISFSDMAKKYVDTCSVSKPVKGITFLESAEGIDFSSGEPDFELVTRRELLSFALETDSDTFRIKKMYFVRNGQYKTIKLDECGWQELPYR